MPVEIRELVIRAVVDPQASPADRPAAGRAAPAAGPGRPGSDVVAECVEQVLDILRLDKER